MESNDRACQSTEVFLALFEVLLEMLTTLPSNEMIKTLQQVFPGADLTTLDAVGADAVLRVVSLVKVESIGLLYASIVTYAVAFQRWVSVSREVNALENAYVIGANRFMQARPA